MPPYFLFRYHGYYFDLSKKTLIRSAVVQTIRLQSYYYRIRVFPKIQRRL